MCRLTAVLPMAICWLVATVLPAEEPVRTVVLPEVANVHSGPSQKYYVTAELPQGTAVEVYRMTSDGWCGIRPPRDSFSYVRAEHVRKDATNPDQLIAIVDQTKTRVGSLLSAAHNVEYIALDQGERLIRVGEPVRLGSPPVRWERVSPPAGEFRWIRRDDLAIGESPTTATAPLANTQSSDPNAPVVTSSNIEKSLAIDALPAKSATVATTSRSEPTTSSSSPLSPLVRPHGSMSTIPIPVTEQPAIDEVTTIEPTPTPEEPKPSSAWKAVDTSIVQSPPIQTASEPPVAHPVTSPETAPPVITAIAELDIELAQQVKQNVERWQLDRILMQANNLHVRAMDTSTRETVAALRDRIVQFQDIQKRHIELAPLISDLPDGQVVLASAVVPAPRPPATRPHGAFETHSLQPDVVRVEGWLVPVAGSRRNLPRFALTDQHGDILCFVTPSSSLELAQWRTTLVQVVGRRDASSDNQIVAERVTPVRSLQR